MARVDGGPEALLRLDERRRLLGQPPLGPMLLTADAQRAGLPVPGRHGHRHSGRARNRLRPRRRPLVGGRAPRTICGNTFNRVTDYPAPGAASGVRRWTGGRLSVSSSSVGFDCAAQCRAGLRAGRGDRRRLVDQLGVQLAAAGDRPVAAGRLRPSGHQRERSTITPSATAVGAQVRRIEVSTVNGTTTLRFDEPGKPLTAALPYGETPWVRITAVGTDDGSPGVQFGITDLSITQYDASGFAHPVDLRHTVVVPGPPAGIGGRALGSGLGAAGPAGLCRGPRRRALRGDHGAGARGTGQPEPHADGAGPDRGDADGVGARRGRVRTWPT